MSKPRPIPGLTTAERTMWRQWAAIFAFVLLVVPEARADAVADFYKGKLIRVVVGFGSGGGYDVYARLLSRHLGKHIPGNPSLVVQNMPGAGGLRAANFIFSAAPRDGTTIGTFSRDIPLLAVMGTNTGAQFDPRRFTWLGSSSSFRDDAYVLIVRSDAPVKSIEEARRPGGPVLVLGGSGEGASGNDVPMILRDTLGLNVKVVGGYPDTAAIFLAIERGEVNGRTVDLSSVRTFRPQWLMPGGGMRMLLQFGRATRHPDFPEVPTARELAPTDAARALIEMTELPYLVARPFMAPPDVPPDRVEALRAAFLAMHEDPEYLEEAARLRLDVSPVGGSDILRTIERIAGASPEVVDHLRRLWAETKAGG
jgi:tripartite-type tricarboxylate transporter receptor subunit TctC